MYLLFNYVYLYSFKVIFIFFKSLNQSAVNNLVNIASNLPIKNLESIKLISNTLSVLSSLPINNQNAVLILYNIIQFNKFIY